MSLRKRYCYACGSNNTRSWYLNRPTNLVLCNNCYSHYISKPRQNALVSNGHGDYWGLHDWIRKRRPKPFSCENCNIKEPKQLANIDGIYERDIEHFKWVCNR